MVNNHKNLKIDIRKDSLSKYLSIEIKEKDLDKFQLAMILNGVNNLLKPSVRHIGDCVLLEYEISNLISLEKIFNQEKSPSEIIDIFLDFIEIVSQSKNYYLDYSLFLIDKKYMFYDNMTSQLMIIYLPLLSYSEIDLLNLLKSELFKDANTIYSRDEYSSLIFTIMRASTLMNLKYSLIELEDKIYKKIEKESCNQGKKPHDIGNLASDSKGQLNHENFQAKRCFAYENKTNNKVENKNKQIDNNKISEDNLNKLKLLSIIIISALIISGFILIALKFDLQLTPIIIIAVIISLISPLIVTRALSLRKASYKVFRMKRKSAMSNKALEDIDNPRSSSRNTLEGEMLSSREEYMEPIAKTLLIKDLVNKYKLINLINAQVFPLDFNRSEVLSLGRLNSSDIKIEEASVGRNHLSFTKRSSEIYICDNNSLNGTSINGIQINPLKNYILENGDVISIGSTSLKFEIG